MQNGPKVVAVVGEKSIHLPEKKDSVRAAEMKKILIYISTSF